MPIRNLDEVSINDTHNDLCGKSCSFLFIYNGVTGQHEDAEEVILAKCLKYETSLEFMENQHGFRCDECKRNVIIHG